MVGTATQPRTMLITQINGTQTNQIRPKGQESEEQAAEEPDRHHDQRAGHRRVQHSQRAEQERQQERDPDRLGCPHVHHGRGRVMTRVRVAGHRPDRRGAGRRPGRSVPPSRVRAAGRVRVPAGRHDRRFRGGSRELLGARPPARLVQGDPGQTERRRRLAGQRGIQGGPAMVGPQRAVPPAFGSGSLDVGVPTGGDGSDRGARVRGAHRDFSRRGGGRRPTEWGADRGIRPTVTPRSDSRELVHRRRDGRPNSPPASPRPPPTPAPKDLGNRRDPAGGPTARRPVARRVRRRGPRRPATGAVTGAAGVVPPAAERDGRGSSAGSLTCGSGPFGGASARPQRVGIERIWAVGAGADGRAT